MPRWWRTNWKSIISKEKYSTEKILNFSDIQWYKRVSFSDWKQKNSHFLVHRLVYCVFNNISLKFEWHKSKTLILHKNDKRDDNRLENLFIWTHQDNIDDMMKKWRWKGGSAERVKIWFSDVEKIKQKYEELGSIYKVAPLFWVSYSIISRVINNKIWVRK